MREILRSNDVVCLSWISALLADSGIEAVILDTHMSVLEGSISAIPRRMMVNDDQYEQAMALVKAAEQELSRKPDFLLNGRIVLHQPKTGFRSAIDPVMLAAAVCEKPMGKVLDIGSGVGTAALCYAHRVPDNPVMALEEQPEMAALARENVAANGLKNRIAIVEGDLLDAPKVLEPASFQHVMANPPYVAAAQADPSMDFARAASHVEGHAGIADWISFAHARLVHKGSLTLIYDPRRLDELMVALRGNFGGVTVFPLWPSIGPEQSGKDAKRIIVQARKGVRTPARICTGLVLHEADGSYTSAVERILRDGEALRL